MNIVRRKEVFALFLGDITVFILSLYLTLTLRFNELPSGSTLLTHIVPFSVLFLAAILISFIAGLYEKHTLSLKLKLPMVLTRVQLVNAVISIAFFYFIPYFNITPKMILFIYLVISLVLMVAWRMAIAETLGQRRRAQALLIARRSKDVDDLHHEINHNNRYGTQFVGWIDLSTKISGEEILNLIKTKRVSVIVADFMDKSVDELMPTLYKLIFSGVEFRDIQKLYEEVFDRVPLSLVNDTWFLENVSSTPKTTFDAGKRIMDIVASGIVGAISLVIYPFVYIAIKLEDKGPLFITQERIGKNNNIVKILKFRSMTRDDRGISGTTNKVTRVGNFLRKTRIDELPQLWNVLRGDVSLIGPRPELPALVETYDSHISYYNMRHIVKPGLSGWAQIYHENHTHPHLHGHAIEATKEKISYDLYYIKNRSLFLDVKIALQTLKVLFSFVGR